MRWASALAVDSPLEAAVAAAGAHVRAELGGGPADLLLVFVCGLASGGRQPGTNALFLGRRVHRGGCVGVALAGDVAVDAIVAQGCRPIGEPAFVTRCERNLLYELDGRRAADVLRALFDAAAPHERALFRDSLFLGIVMDEAQQTYRAGDFLIRNLLGLDPRSGALAVGAALRPGMIVQLHLRDAAASAHELRTLLAARRAMACSSFPASAAASASTGRRTTTRGCSAPRWARCRSAGSSATARSAPCAGRRSCTATRAPAGSSARGADRRLFDERPARRAAVREPEPLVDRLLDGAEHRALRRRAEARRTADRQPRVGRGEARRAGCRGIGLLARRLVEGRMTSEGEVDPVPVTLEPDALHELLHVAVELELALEDVDLGRDESPLVAGKRRSARVAEDRAVEAVGRGLEAREEVLLVLRDADGTDARLEDSERGRERRCTCVLAGLLVERPIANHVDDVLLVALEHAGRGNDRALVHEALALELEAARRQAAGILPRRVERRADGVDAGGGERAQQQSQGQSCGHGPPPSQGAAKRRRARAMQRECLPAGGSCRSGPPRGCTIWQHGAIPADLRTADFG